MKVENSATNAFELRQRDKGRRVNEPPTHTGHVSESRECIVHRQVHHLSALLYKHQMSSEYGARIEQPHVACGQLSMRAFGRCRAERPLLRTQSGIGIGIESGTAIRIVIQSVIARNKRLRSLFYVSSMGGTVPHADIFVNALMPWNFLTTIQPAAKQSPNSEIIAYVMIISLYLAQRRRHRYSKSRCSDSIFLVRSDIPKVVIWNILQSEAYSGRSRDTTIYGKRCNGVKPERDEEEGRVGECNTCAVYHSQLIQSGTVSCVVLYHAAFISS
ncbi:hypothetical protein EVAR_27423_1 [Eumeta japonica]|uniref:Uncharacterized protein n=1 Tax=Eumeta variegata TaxID=151549 RepID=A0A4C1VMS3_EUMVA|nr:hypothetical protein EVAR_27423_1 [Eumeta japonica]